MEPIKRLPYASLMILDTEDKTTLSPIYSSQSYQTFYQVFAKLDVDKVEGSTEKVKLKGIDFELINFRGPFRLTIDKVDVKSLPLGEDETRRVLYFKIHVKVATSREPRLDYPVTQEDLNELILPEHQFISHNDILYVERELLSLYGKTYDEVPEYSESNDQSSYKGLFDTEFFDSNGKDSIFKRNEAVRVRDHIQINDESASFTGEGGHLCYSSKSIFVIA